MEELARKADIIVDRILNSATPLKDGLLPEDEKKQFLGLALKALQGSKDGFRDSGIVDIIRFE
jgi:hypothetical protein